MWSVGPCGGLLLLIAKPHGFPTFHHCPSLVGSCANSIRWYSSETSELFGFGPRPEFSPSPGCPQPHPIPSSESLQVSQFIHRAVCIPLTWSQPSQAPPGTRPLLHCPLKPRRLGSSDTKHDPVMSYLSVCICIIRAKGCSYVTMQCKLTVLICKRFEGLQLTSILKLSVSAGAVPVKVSSCLMQKPKDSDWVLKPQIPTYVLLKGHHLHWILQLFYVRKLGWPWYVSSMWGQNVAAQTTLKSKLYLTHSLWFGLAWIKWGCDSTLHKPADITLWCYYTYTQK